jgi:flagellar motor switch protein FliN/FliY
MSGDLLEQEQDGVADLATDGKKPRVNAGTDLGFVMDVPIELTVEIGRKTMKIAEVLTLGPGSILELDKASGEPLDVFLNNRCVARGEAVVIGDRYGVRITEVFAMDEKRGGSR